MEIKSLNEIKSVLSKFKKASGVGYVVAPQLIKIAHQVGLQGYDKAMNRWWGGMIKEEKVYQPGEAIPTWVDFGIDWDGPALIERNGRLLLGIRKTIEEIEEAIK